MRRQTSRQTVVRVVKLARPTLGLQNLPQQPQGSLMRPVRIQTSRE
jgi:hypothetical protein